MMEIYRVTPKKILISFKNSITLYFVFINNPSYLFVLFIQRYIILISSHQLLPFKQSMSIGLVNFISYRLPQFLSRNNISNHRYFCYIIKRNFQNAFSFHSLHLNSKAIIAAYEFFFYCSQYCHKINIFIILYAISYRNLS